MTPSKHSEKQRVVVLFLAMSASLIINRHCVTLCDATDNSRKLRLCESLENNSLSFQRKTDLP